MTIRNNRNTIFMPLVIAWLFTFGVIYGQESNSAYSGGAAAVVKERFALKTNLLFDAVTAINIEAEVMIHPDFSLAGELILPWWLLENKQHALQVRAFNIEGKYWLRRSGEMQGFFLGWHGGAGIFDLEWNRKGYQGEYYLSTGALAGYSMPIGNNFNLEFTFGVGYLNADYRRYNAKQDFDGEWHLIKQHEGSFKWIGPTRAKVSLVWFPRFNKRGGKR